MELPKQIAILRHCALAFKDSNEHARLFACIYDEGLVHLSGDGDVALKEFRHHTVRDVQALGQKCLVRK